jgi:trehalose synthase
VKRYDSLIFTLKKYVLKELKEIPSTFIPPSIDPVAEKNRHVDDDTIADVLEKREIDADRPTITQVSRYDPWKDPLGVIDAYRLVKRKIPDVQLVMVGSMASDDPEGSVFYENTVRHAGDDPEIRLLTNLPDLEVNAIQRASDVVLQKSVREGFGLTVTEAMWKKRAVVANNVGGIRAQIKNRETGFLVNTTEGMAERTILLLKHPEKRREMGESAHEYVRQNFLMTRLLRQYLELFQGMPDTRRL